MPATAKTLSAEPEKLTGDVLPRRATALRWLHSAAVSLIVVLFVVSQLQSVRSVNCQWDEMVDLGIAREISQDLLHGSLDDASQARLPMYLSALAFRLFRPADLDTALLISRMLSVLAGAGAIVATSILGTRWFGAAVGLISSAALAVSPYFLDLSRLALTEGDAFCPLSVLLVLLAFDYLRLHPSACGVVMTGLSLGIALSSKFTAVYVFPALMLSHAFLFLRSGRHGGDQGGSRCAYRRLMIGCFALLALVGATLLLSLSQALPGIKRDSRLSAFIMMVSTLTWATAFVGAILSIVLSVLRRNLDRSRWSPRGCWALIVPLAIVYCFTLFPEHLLNRQISFEMGRRILGWGPARPTGILLQNLWLNAGLIMFKLGLPLGVLTITALLAAPWRLDSFPVRTLYFVVLACLGLILLMPLSQTFYLMSVYPLLILLTIQFAADISRRIRSTACKIAWFSALAAAMAWVVIGAWSCYPAYGHYGYEAVGTHWLGRETRGTRSLVHVTLDGTEDAVRWCGKHLRASDEVLLLVRDLHVARASIGALGGTEVRFTLRDPSQSTDLDATHEYIVAHHAGQHSYSESPIPGAIALDFEPVKVISRGYGSYRIAYTTIYRRRR
jgi:hypothetical protein